MANTNISVQVLGCTLTGSAQDVANVLLAIHGAGQAQAQAPTGTGVIAPETPVAQAQRRTDYTNTHKGFDNVLVKAVGKTVKITHKDGGFIHEGFVRKALNARVKGAGATWDAEAKAWTFTSAQKAKAFEKAFTLDGLDAEVDALVAQANARNARKNAK